MSRDKLRAHPLHFFKDSIWPITKENPGTPSIHLLAELTMKSMFARSKLSGTAPKLLIASTKNDASGACAFTSFPTSATGCITPVEVSQCTMATLVMDLSLFRISSTFFKSTLESSAPWSTTWTTDTHHMKNLQMFTLQFLTLKPWVFTKAKWLTQLELIPGFLSMKPLGVSLLPPKMGC